MGENLTLKNIKWKWDRSLYIRYKGNDNFKGWKLWSRRIKKLLENEEMIIIGYDKKNKTIDRSIKEFWKIAHDVFIQKHHGRFL